MKSCRNCKFNIICMKYNNERIKDGIELITRVVSVSPWYCEYKEEDIKEKLRVLVYEMMAECCEYYESLGKEEGDVDE